MEDNKRTRAGRNHTTTQLFFFFFYIRARNHATPEPVAMTTVGFCGNSGRYSNQQGLSHFLSRTILPLLNLRARNGGSTPESLKAISHR